MGRYSITTKNFYEKENDYIDMCNHAFEYGGSVILQGDRLTLEPNAQFTTGRELVSFVESMVFNPWLCAEFGIIPAPSMVVSKKLKKRSHYNPSTATITIAQQKWAMTNSVVLHEFAHHIVSVKNMSDNDVHGDTFASVYATLVGIFVSEDNKRALLHILGE